MLTKCPCCNTSWQSENRIIDDLREYPTYRDYTEQQLIDAAASHGDTEETPKYFGKNVLLCEDPCVYDGALWYQCQNCGCSVGRFSGKIIDDTYTYEDENAYRRSLICIL